MDIPETIGRYQVIGDVGRGGMADVYLAYDPRFERQVAIKILSPEFLRHPEFLARFKREARIIASLENRSILPVYDFGEDDGIVYIVMRYLDTGTLTRRLQARDLTYADLIRLTQQLAEALDYAHKRGVIHRDLKPANIFLDEAGNVLLGDFGIAKITEDTQQLTGSAVVGTPSYMSPEQAMGERLDGRADIYSLGILLFRLCTGKLPFRAETPMGMAIKHINNPFPNPREFNPDIPSSLIYVILKATAKDRENRYGTVQEMASALARGLRDMSDEQLKAPILEPIIITSNNKPVAVDASDFTQTAAPQPEQEPEQTQTAAGPIKPEPDPTYTIVSPVKAQAEPAPLPDLPISEQETRMAPPPVSASVTMNKKTSRFPAWLWGGGILIIILLSVVGGLAVRPLIFSSPTPTSQPTGISTQVAIANTATPSPEASPTHTPTITPSPTPVSPTPVLVANADRPIIFASGDSPSQSQIFIMEMDGSERTQLTDDLNYNDEPDLSPDGQQIAYETNTGSAWLIKIMAVEGGGQREVVPGREPAWSPDGRYLAYETTTSPSQIWMVDVETGVRQQITNDTHANRAPGWSPDGRELVIMSQIDGVWQLVIVDVTSSESRQITTSDLDKRFPVWSPDGELIAYNTLNDSGQPDHIWVVTPAGESAKQLTFVGQNGRPAWSPDSQLLLFNSNRDGAWFIYQMARDGSNQTQLTNTNNDVQADWGG